MNRVEYMTRLAELLQDVPVEERVSAMQYYNDYFNDAGEENEAQVIKELGSPEKVAEEMKAGLGKDVEDEGEFTETGFSGYTYEGKDVPNASVNSEQTEEKKPWTNKWVKIGLIVLVVAAALPILGPIAVGVVATVFGLMIAMFAVFFALVVASLALIVAAVAIFIKGILMLGTGLATTLLLVGVGLVLGTVGVIATVASIRLCIIVIPGIFRFFVNIFSRLLHRNKKEV